MTFLSEVWVKLAALPSPVWTTAPTSMVPLRSRLPIRLSSPDWSTSRSLPLPFWRTLTEARPVTFPDPSAWSTIRSLPAPFCVA